MEALMTQLSLLVALLVDNFMPLLAIFITTRHSKIWGVILTMAFLIFGYNKLIFITLMMFSLSNGDIIISKIKD